MTAKRRLPVLQSPAEDSAPPRPPWQWSVFGAFLTLLLWLVLAAVTMPFVRHASSSVVLLGVPLAMQAVASLGVGVVVARYCPGRGIREAAGGGALAIAFATTVTASLAAWSAGLRSDEVFGAVVGGLVLVLPATLFAALGGWWGSRDKRVLVGP